MILPPKIIKLKLLLLIISILGLITLVNLLLGYSYLPGPLTEDKNIVIEPGLSVHEISKKLADHQVISYPQLFELIAKFYALSYPLKSGEYKVTIGISPVQILQKLAAGRSIIHRLSIPEGYTVNDIIEELSRQELLTGQISPNIPEGYLMPSTYYYSYGDQRQMIIDKMKISMSMALDQVMLKLPKDSPIKNRKDLLILASIIEKEAGNDEERSAIAAVFLNRMKKGMKLQADPTVIYAITEGKYKLSRLLNRKDLAIKSPYNTYYVQGLPPGAIACPGKKSLEAVVSPLNSKALYFVINGKGGHAFAETLEEHNLNVQKLKKLQAANLPETK